MKAAITGAAGYVGSVIARYFKHRGWEVMELGRRRTATANEYHRFELADESPSFGWHEADAVVHCAYDFSLRNWSDLRRVNIEGSIRLLRSAKAHGIERGVFLSSLSSFPGCRSLYGKAKLAVEAEASRLGFSIVRSGLVYGENPGGMMGSLIRTVRSRRLVPLVGDGSFQQYLTFEEDLARLVLSLCESKTPAPKYPIHAAYAVPMTLLELLNSLASSAGGHPRFIPIPWRVLYFAIKALEFLPQTYPFRSDSLLSLAYPNPQPNFSSPELVQFPFRPFPGRTL